MVFDVAVTPVEEMENVVITEDVQPKYKVYGQDILISDDVAIVYYDNSMNLLALANLLLGKFDSKGNYIISKEIKRDIVVMNKEVEEEKEGYFKATNIFMKKNFYYYINISFLGDGRAKAALYLYEYVGDFLDKDFVVSHIANFVDVFDQDFRGKVKKAFNLVDVALPNDELKIPALAVLMQQMLDEKARVLSLHDIAAQAYVMRLLQELEKMEYGRKIVEEYKKLMAKYGMAKMSWIKQKAILDRIVNKNGGYQKLVKNMPETKKILEEEIKAAREIEKKKLEVEKEEKTEKTASSGGEKTAAKKAAAKKPAAKKPAAKKAAGKKAGKKDDKKKDKKKGGGVSAEEREKFAKLAAAELAKKTAKDKKEKPKEEKKEEKESQEPPKKKQPEQQAGGKALNFDDVLDASQNETSTATVNANQAKAARTTLNASEVNGKGVETADQEGYDAFEASSGT